MVSLIHQLDLVRKSEQTTKIALILTGITLAVSLVALSVFTLTAVAGVAITLGSKAFTLFIGASILTALMATFYIFKQNQTAFLRAEYQLEKLNHKKEVRDSLIQDINDFNARKAALDASLRASKFYEKDAESCRNEARDLAARIRQETFDLYFRNCSEMTSATVLALTDMPVEFETYVEQVQKNPNNLDSLFYDIICLDGVLKMPKALCTGLFFNNELRQNKSSDKRETIYLFKERPQESKDDFNGNFSYPHATINNVKVLLLMNLIDHYMPGGDIFTQLQLAGSLELTKAKEKLVRHIAERFRTYNQDDRFLELPEDLILEILDSDHLQIENEGELFNYLIDLGLASRGETADSYTSYIRKVITAVQSLGFNKNLSEEQQFESGLVYFSKVRMSEDPEVRKTINIAYYAIHEIIHFKFSKPVRSNALPLS